MVMTQTRSAHGMVMVTPSTLLLTTHCFVFYQCFTTDRQDRGIYLESMLISAYCTTHIINILPLLVHCTITIVIS